MSILRAPFIAQLALKHCADARSLLGTSAAYGPSNHRGDTERGALTSGTLEYGIGDTETGELWHNGDTLGCRLLTCLII